MDIVKIDPSSSTSFPPSDPVQRDETGNKCIGVFSEQKTTSPLALTEVQGLNKDRIQRGKSPFALSLLEDLKKRNSSSSILDLHETISYSEEISETKEDIDSYIKAMDQAQVEALKGNWDLAENILDEIPSQYWRDDGYALICYLASNAALREKSTESKERIYKLYQKIVDPNQKETVKYNIEVLQVRNLFTSNFAPDDHPLVFIPGFTKDLVLHPKPLAV